ncbi:MAG TPA: M20/M25/M40 family metallo-hydrolase, partial [Bacteroidales bacterium]
SARLICTLYALPHGVVAMSNTIPGLVETSTNLAFVRHTTDGRIEIGTSQRSALQTAKYDISQQVASVFILGSMEYVHTMGYPGWKPNKNSRILKHAEGVYQKMFGKEPVITAIHAGLECALFVDKIPGLDVISVGPTIKGAHSPDERLSIESVEKFWKYLIEILETW